MYETPFFAHLKIRKITGFTTCSGVILDRNKILTAGHCLKHAFKNGWNVTVAFENNLLSSGLDIPMSSFVINPTYDLNPDSEEGRRLDLGIVKLQYDIKFGENVKYINFADFKQDGALTQWQGCQFVGSGKVVEKDLKKCKTSQAKKVYKGALLGSLCCNSINRFEHPQHYHAYTTENACLYSTTNSACEGDSGGPVTCRDPISQEVTLIGITTERTHCCDAANNLLIESPFQAQMVPMDTKRKTWISLARGIIG
uniref:Peptidase S1 domain-containing protein n=1 Tax=Panagrolaimus sp. PS1159 TaxID=55785 RepID=A0AC35FCJ0_9BILA